MFGAGRGKSSAITRRQKRRNLVVDFGHATLQLADPLTSLMDFCFELIDEGLVLFSQML